MKKERVNGDVGVGWKGEKGMGRSEERREIDGERERGEKGRGEKRSERKHSRAIKKSLYNDPKTNKKYGIVIFRPNILERNSVSLHI